MPTRVIHRILWILVLLLGAGDAPAQGPPVTFNTNFEGASLGKIEILGENAFRCYVQGQHDERGHNRQANWYYFRIDHAAGRELTLTLTDVVGEYNDKPGAVPMGPDIVPVFSDDGKTWRHFPDEAASWDAQKKELTLKFKPQRDSIWIAHVPPYTPRDLARLLAEVDRSPHARVEVIGKSVRGRDLHLVTVTDVSVADTEKKVVWLQARQHAWESGTSFVMEGALRFVTSDDPKAAELRRRVIFKFTPMVDVDGCAAGHVRFNANGYDVNRHWSQVDLRDKKFLALMPEIWYTKKAIVGSGRIDLMVNLHNTETAEYLDTQVDDPAVLKTMQRLYDLLVEHSTFDPSRKLASNKTKVDDTNSLFAQYRIPVMLMEQRISTGKKLGHRPTTQDRLDFGRDLITAMARAVVE
jgi:hypothetical protein